MTKSPNNAAIDAYKTSSIENAPGIKIVRMLYEGAMRFIDRAAAAGPEDPHFGTWVTRADAIVLELRLSLKEEHSPELSDNLANLYVFCESRLALALRDGDVAMLAEARDVLARLLEAWKHIELEDGRVPA